MKTEDILDLISLIKNKTGDVKSILDDIQQISLVFANIATNLAELSKLAKTVVGKIEGLKK